MALRRPVPIDERHRRPGSVAGFSLLEATISTFLVGMVLVTSMHTLGMVVRARVYEGDRQRALFLARLMMTEILPMPYQDSTRSSEEDGDDELEADESVADRSTFDDIGDYHLWSEFSPKWRDGTPLANYKDWFWMVHIHFVDPIDPETVISSDQGLKRITVTVEAPDGTQTTLKGLRSAFGAPDQPPTVDTTVVTWTGVDLQVGSHPQTRVQMGVNQVNQANID